MPTESSVTPIIVPLIDWDTFLKDVLDSTGHSPVRSIDESGQKLAPCAKFLASLQEFRENRTANPIDVLRNANVTLNHLAFSFLVKGSSVMILKTLEMTTLHGISAKANKGRVVLLSGTLGEWKLATVELCNAQRADLRWLGKTFLEFFFQFGLKNIFANFDSKIRSDGSLLLTYKG